MNSQGQNHKILKIKLQLQFKVGISSKNNIRLAIYQYGTYTRDIEPGNQLRLCKDYPRGLCSHQTRALWSLETPAAAALD